MSVLGGASYQVLLGAVPLWAVRHGYGSAEAGLATTAMLGATVCAQLFIPALARRAGPGRTLALGLSCMAVPAVFYPVAEDLRILVAIAIVRGLGFAILTGVGSTLVATYAPSGRHGESAGLIGLVTALPGLVALPAGVALTQHSNFSSVAVLGALPLLGVRAGLKLGGAGWARMPRPRVACGSVSHQRAVALAAPASLCLLLATFASGGVATFLPIALPNGPTAAVALAAFGLGSMLSRWRAGPLADRANARLLLGLALVAAALGVGSIGVGLALGPPGANVLVAAGAVLFGVGFGAVQNSSIVIAFAAVPSELLLTSSATWNICFDAGTAMGAATVGHLGDASGLGLAGAYGMTSVALLLVAIVILPMSDNGARRRVSAGIDQSDGT